MAKSQMTLSMPDQLIAWANARVADGRFDSVSTYICALIGDDQEREERRKTLLAAIDEGLASPVTNVDPFRHLEELRSLLKNMKPD